MEIPTINDAAELLAHVLAVESEAGERYAELAETMDAANNIEVAKLFRYLSEIEELHADKVRNQASELKISLPEQRYNWQAPDGPESGAFEDLHYQMTMEHALLLARHNEQRAVDYFAAIAEQVDSEEIKAMATEMVEDEKEHVELLNKWLDKLSDADKDWNEDMDDPIGQD